MIRTFYIILIFFFPFTSFSQEALLCKIIFRDGKTINTLTNDQKVYIITEFACLKYKLSDIDSIDFGVLPDYFQEKKINSQLELLNNINPEIRKKTFNNLLLLNSYSIPIIKHYNSEHINNIIDTTYNSTKLLNSMIHKFNINNDFIEKDIISLHSNIRFGGIFSFKKKRHKLNFANFNLNREDIFKIYIIKNQKK